MLATIKRKLIIITTEAQQKCHTNAFLYVVDARRYYFFSVFWILCVCVVFSLYSLRLIYNQRAVDILCLCERVSS